HSDEDLLGFVALLVFMRSQFFKARHTGLGLGLAALGILAHPFQFFLNRALASRFSGFFLLQSLLLLFQPRAVVALPGNAVAPVELQYPFTGVIEEVSVVSNGD